MTALSGHLLALAGDAPVFAVLDGAQFANLPDLLRESRFRARPLHLDRGGNDPGRW